MNALTMAIFILIAFSLRSTDANIVTPCSVKANGVVFILLLSWYAVTNGDLRNNTKTIFFSQTTNDRRLIFLTL
jgi:hypothetical protein